MHASSQSDVNQSTAILSVTVFGVIGSIVFLLLPLLIGAFSEELALSAAQIGWLGSADMIGMFVAAIVATNWIRRADWKRAAAVFSALLLLCHLLSGWISGFEALIAVRIVAGFAGGSMMSIALTSLGDTRNPDRYFALFISGQMGLGAIGLLVFPDLIGRFGLSGAFISLAILTGLAMAMIPLMPRQGDFAAPEKVSGIPLRKLLPGGIALLACFLFDVGIMMVWAFTERMGDTAGLEAGFIGNALAGSLLAALAGSLLAAAMGARFGRILPLVITLILQAIALWLLMGALTPQRFMAGVMVFAFAWNFPVAFQLAITVSVDVTGRLVVLFLSAVKLGYAAAPVLAVMLIVNENYQPLLVVSGVFYLVSAVAFAVLAARRRSAKIEGEVSG